MTEEDVIENKRSTPLSFIIADGNDDFSAWSLDEYEQSDLNDVFETHGEGRGHATISFNESKIDGDSCASHPSKRARLTQPTRPLSAYSIFSKRIREQVEQEMEGEIGFDRLGKVIGERWRNLDEKERAFFERLADGDMNRYLNQMDSEKRREGESHDKKDHVDIHIQGRDSLRTIKIGIFPPPPPGRIIGLAPSYLGLAQGQKITLFDRDGRKKVFRIYYYCYSVKRSDLDHYLAQIPHRPQYHRSILGFR